MNVSRFLMGAALVGASLAACGEKLDPVPRAGVCAERANVSYRAEIAPLLLTYCQPCHSASALDRQGAPAAVNLDTYAEAAAKAAQANARIQAGSMPPADVQLPLSTDERCAFQAWVDHDTPEN